MGAVIGEWRRRNRDKVIAAISVSRVFDKRGGPLPGFVQWSGRVAAVIMKVSKRLLEARFPQRDRAVPRQGTAPVGGRAWINER